MKDHHRMRAWDGSQYWYANIPFEGPWLRSESGKKRNLEEFQESSDIEEWELCTGLRDKNGVLFFEGDIDSKGRLVEIIGNAHQNPELLENQK